MPRAHQPTPDPNEENEVVLEAPKPGQKDTRPPVTCIVTKAGDGQIFTGEYDPETKAPGVYEKNDRITGVPAAIADELEDRNFVMIVDDDSTTDAKD